MLWLKPERGLKVITIAVLSVLFLLSIYIINGINKMTAPGSILESFG